MNSFVVDCGTYPFDILVFFGENVEDLFNDIKGKLSKSDFKGLKKSEFKAGKAIILDTNQTVLWLREKPTTPTDFGLLSHEIYHCTGFILRSIGIQYSEETEEAYAYLIQYLTEQIYKKLT